jgi:hypothetical protein
VCAQFFNSHKGALQAMFAKYAAGTARLTRSAVLTFSSEFRITPSLLAPEEVDTLVTEVLRASGREGDIGGPAELLAYPEFVELVGRFAYLAASDTVPSAPMLSKLHMLVSGMAARGATLQGDAWEAMVKASVDALQARAGGGGPGAVERARDAMLQAPR